MKNKTWKNISPQTGEALRQTLISLGGSEDPEVKGQSEAWRNRLKSSVFTFYKTGTLYFSGGQGEIVEKAIDTVSNMIEGEKTESEKDFFVGMDETGKGEVLGPSVLVVVIMQKQVLSKIDEMLGSADTKKKREFASWDSLFREIDQYRGHGVSYEIETIPPWDVDKYNVNQIMDVVYHRLLSRLLLGLELSRCRITLDDYGIGRNLHMYMRSLSRAGAEVKVEAKADEKYVEVRTASVLSKWRRELAMRKIREKFLLPGVPVGSGNAGDPQTVRWLKEWKRSGQQWPWFVKVSWKTVRELDGYEEPAKKSSPPIRHDVLSRESQNLFRDGKLSTSSLTIICPACGTFLRSCKLTPEPVVGLEGRCVQCGEVIPNLGITLRYYCGVAVLDSSTIIAGTLSKDLERRGFFAGYTLLLHPIVAKETDNKGGKTELEQLADYSAMDRISLRKLDGSPDAPPDQHDGVIIQTARSRDAILVTRDKGMYGNAVAEGIFCLTFKS